MDFNKLINRRYSSREYRNDPVEDVKLMQVLDAARLAPTAANKQPFELIVINTKGREEELLKIYNRDWFVQAPIVICICTRPDKAWSRMDGKNFADVDATIAMDHLILCATDLGLATCWIGAFNPDEAREILNIPDDYEPLAFTTLGYANDMPHEKKRKQLSELVHYEIW
ncbi:MAG: nitroreductase family protein [Armatimonadota bacterium]